MEISPHTQKISDFLLPSSNTSNTNSILSIRDLLLRQNSVFIVLIIDEIDFLFHSSPSFKSELVQLFHLAFDPTVSLVLIGIANTLDFSLLDLPSSSNLKINELSFPSYTAEDIHGIVSDRISRVPNAWRVIHPDSIDYVSLQISKSHGDARHALGLVSSSVLNLSSSSTALKSIQFPLRNPILTVLEVNEAIRSSGLNNKDRIVKNLPFDQIVVLLILKREMEGKNSKMGMEELGKKVRRVIKQEKLPELGELSELIKGLQQKGMLKLANYGKELVAVEVSKEDLKFGISGNKEANIILKKYLGKVCG